MSTDAAWLSAPDAGVRYAEPTTDADEFVAGMEAAHEERECIGDYLVIAHDEVIVSSGRFSAVDARELAEALLLAADTIDPAPNGTDMLAALIYDVKPLATPFFRGQPRPRFEVINGEWDPQP